ncbi:MAG: hypothetical protein IPM94_16065 [bacterium]|nr:hypothetical protein [bacterium]
MARSELKASRIISAVLAVVVVIPIATAESEELPSFSVWRILAEAPRGLEYREDQIPLEEGLASQCCSIRPGQSVTLIRGGKVFGPGTVEHLFASQVPRAGDDRMLYFSASGFPDSVGGYGGPPTFPRRSDVLYDLFVVGSRSVEAADLTPDQRKRYSKLLESSAPLTPIESELPDWFFTVDGVLHAVMRASRPGTGLWGYVIFRIERDQTPLVVYEDYSWST